MNTTKEINDGFRRVVSCPITLAKVKNIGLVVMTSSVTALALEDQFRLFDAVAQYEDFIPDNNPHGEHDMAFFDFAGDKCIWKYDSFTRPESLGGKTPNRDKADLLKELDHGSDAPADVVKTMRVLTIMNAAEY